MGGWERENEVVKFKIQEEEEELLKYFQGFFVEDNSSLLCRLWVSSAFGHRQCDQIGRFSGLWATLKAFGNN